MIKKHANNVWTYQTKKPDIVFINKVGQEIALEIETGFEKHKERLLEKFTAVKSEHSERVYIVLTDNKMVNSYAGFGIRILLRKEIKEFIRLQFSGQKNSVIGNSLNRTNGEFS